MKNILIIQNKILYYRKPIYNGLAQYYNLTVLHSGEKSVFENDLYKEIIVPFKKIGPFFYQKKILEIANSGKYHIVIVMFDIRWIMNIILSFFVRKEIQFIWWGPWITNKKYVDNLKIFLSNREHNIIFYCEAHKKEFIERGVDEKKLFVANNTCDVSDRIYSFKNNEKNRIIFVGSLDRRKQNDLLIQAFSSILNFINKNIFLTIIGEGEELERLRELVIKLSIADRVIFVGKVTDLDILKKYYEEAIVSVSFGQAGLSVLQSLGYGVPFITKKNAISGGEKTNIIDGYNGFFCEDNIESLSEKLIEITNNIDLAKEMGKNAYEYYSKFCTKEKMIQGIIESIERI